MPQLGGEQTMVYVWKACVAYGQAVIMSIGYGKFDLSIQQITTRVPASLFSAASNTTTTPKCPMCSQYVEPNNVAFNNCWWEFSGVNEYNQSCSSDWQHADDAYHRFNDNSNAKVIWIRLVLEVVKDKPT
ncbi:unnamed protein product [Rotaria sordida]|uniref:Uncharacterized protein n=1 Tax=Rotaria sordida TaxID=392033 RepID=A0A818T9K2_9BILA|nr:unnamed protein product [Rotaria sordida]CAF1030623.1 unnamed protein product [Rotaria sordida]CAF1129981.1 unnamed protein product [Rotaria sordida]CAF3614515.1 unnamed protein product [Rotaria sordida]CAF3678754.1 unnamed protein product [Rotaria sordida]